jgi:hypothetical protein
MEQKSCNNCGSQHDLGDMFCERRIMPSMGVEGDDDCWRPIGEIVISKERCI